MSNQKIVPLGQRQFHLRKQFENQKQQLTKPSKAVLDDYLESKYSKPSGAGSYLGAEKLYDAVREEGIYYITFKDIQDWLQEHQSYSLHRRVRRVKKRRRVMVAGIDDQFEADLAILNAPEYEENNDGFKYLLVVIDVFTRYLWVRPLKNKFSTTVVKAFQQIFKQNGREPRRLRTDRGSEFTSQHSRQYFSERKISQIFTNNELQANYAERVIQTLKKKIFRYMVDNNTLKYIDVLPKLVESYNNTWHHGIRAIPKKITKKDEKRLWWQMYWPKSGEKTQRKQKKQKPVKFAFNLKDKVRLSLLRKAFQREYDQRWSGEVFLISYRFVDQGIPLYKLKDYEGEEMTGTYYQNELQRITLPPDTLFVVDKILDRQKRKGVPYVKVSYFGWPSKFNNWIKESDLVDIQTSTNG
jgi:transposase InsO family protein